jgi:WD40 repeat protein
MNWAVFSPDGKQVLTASDDGTARIWNLRTGQQVQALSEPTGEGINNARFSPDGRLVVSASKDGTARIWSAASGRLLQTLNQPGLGKVFNAAFSPDGHLIVSCSNSTAAIWDSVGRQRAEFQYWTVLSDCEFNRNGSEIVTAGDDAQTRIFSTELAGGLGRIEQIAQQRMTQLSTTVKS